MSEHPSEIVLASTERAKLSQSKTTPKRRSGKRCPIKPCREVIATTHVACPHHWAMAHAAIRHQNKAASRSKNLGLTLYTAIAGLVDIWDSLESSGVPRPPDPQHRGNLSCLCAWCGPIIRSALRAMYVPEELWVQLKSKYLHGIGG